MHRLEKILQNDKIVSRVMFALGVILVSFFTYVTIAGAGTNTLFSVSGGKVKASHLNQYHTALGGDLLPRNTAGAISNGTAWLGTSTYKWLKLYAAKGYWATGDIKPHHTYNGLVGCGEGWMVANGSIVNETNYDTEHGAGHWDLYVITSPMSGLYLPNLVAKYPMGSATTAATGTVAIPSVGANTADVSHPHTLNAHYHKWYKGTGAVGFDRTWQSDGVSEIACEAAGSGSTGRSPQGMSGCSNYSAGTYFYCAAASDSGVVSEGSATQDMRPESIEVQYCVRII